ncbi:MAG: hypothetical protein Q7S31_04125 [bacterium]|nr:hypothetical protein [bacterium]
MNHFFDHLTFIEEVVTEIDLHELTPEEREELVQLAQKTLRQHSLTVILDHLPKEKHGHFMSRYQSDPANRELLNWLKQEITEDVEEMIKSQAAQIKTEILAEIKKAKTHR